MKMQSKTKASKQKLQAASRAPAAFWPWISAGMLVLGFWAGAWISPRSPARAGHDESTTAPAESPAARPVRPASIVRPAREPAPATGAPATPAPSDEGIAAEERERRRALTRDLVGTLRARIRHEASVANESTPEGTAQRMRLVAEGWAEALMILAPELVEEEVTAAVSEGLCDPQAQGAELMVLAHLDRALPGTLMVEGVDCVVARKQEDVALWSVLDSWRRTHKPLSPALKSLAETAQDPRTKRRFMTLDEERAARAEVSADTRNSVAASDRGPEPQAPGPSAVEHP